MVDNSGTIAGRSGGVFNGPDNGGGDGDVIAGLAQAGVNRGSEQEIAVEKTGGGQAKDW